MNRKKLALLTCFLSLATVASGKNLTLEERVEYLKKMLEQQISRNQVLEEKLNATLEKEKKERVNLKRFINEDRVYDLFKDSLTLLNERTLELLPEEFILMKI